MSKMSAKSLSIVLIVHWRIYCFQYLLSMISRFHCSPLLYLDLVLDYISDLFNHEHSSRRALLMVPQTIIKTIGVAAWLWRNDFNQINTVLVVFSWHTFIDFTTFLSHVFLYFQVIWLFLKHFVTVIFKDLIQIKVIFLTWTVYFARNCLNAFTF